MSLASSSALLLAALSSSLSLSSSSSSVLPLSLAVPRRQRWTSPRAPPSPPMTTMPFALLSLCPRPKTKTHTLACRWRSKARASAHSWTALDHSARRTTSNLRWARAAAVAVRPRGARGLWRPPSIRLSQAMRCQAWSHRKGIPSD